MSFIENFPFFSILICLFSGVVLSVVNSKVAKKLCVAIIIIVTILSASVLAYTWNTGEYFVYMMGHYPAPWGNEIRAGVLEGLTATIFSIVMLLSVLGGMKHTEKDIEDKKQNLYYLFMMLLLSSILALIYSNDVFTTYVFVELNTLAACGLIVIRQKGHSVVAGLRYMIMNIMGSGLFLIGICFLYDITGHLSMSYVKEQVAVLMENSEYQIPIQIIIGLVCVGLAIKSALFPFHFWVPDTYGYSTCTTSAVLSSLVSKSYIFVLFKFAYRVIGFDVMIESGVLNAFFALGIIGMIGGSVGAIKERDIRRMVACSSVAQIGYIYMGFSTGLATGVIAAMFHMYAHAVTKSLLFVSSAGLTQVSGDSKKFRDLTGAGFRNIYAGLAFTIGSLSMVGIPIFAGFMSKVLFATVAITSANNSWIILITLAISTVLNAMYFLKTILRIYTRDESQITVRGGEPDNSKRYVLTLVAFAFINIFIGLHSEPIINAIEIGLSMFA